MAALNLQVYKCFLQVYLKSLKTTESKRDGNYTAGNGNYTAGSGGAVEIL